MENKMKNVQRFVIAVGLVAFASVASAKSKQQVSLERDVAKFWQSVKVSKNYKMVTSVKAGSKISGISEAAVRGNPFVMVNSGWRRLSESKKRQVAAELFKRWRPYCARTGRYAAIYFQTKSGAQPVAQCSEDDGCALEGDTHE